jgi:hypothetical protein
MKKNKKNLLTVNRQATKLKQNLKKDIFFQIVKIIIFRYQK